MVKYEMFVHRLIGLEKWFMTIYPGFTEWLFISNSLRRKKSLKKLPKIVKSILKDSVYNDYKLFFQDETRIAGFSLQILIINK
jgi:hypothetical protein